MPLRVARYLRMRLLPVMAVLTTLALILVAFGLWRVVQLNNDIISARQHECESGNVVRGHIAFVTSALHDLLALSLAAPPPPGQTRSQKLLRRNFQQITDQLGERLPALAPRDCSRDAVSGAAGPGRG